MFSFLSFYIFLLTFKIICTFLCAFYCWKIARLRFTPTFTYHLFTTAFTLRLATQLQGIFYTRDIVGFLSGYSSWLIIESQLVEVVIVSCFLIGILRKYHTYNNLPFLNDDKD